MSKISIDVIEARTGGTISINNNVVSFSNLNIAGFVTSSTYKCFGTLSVSGTGDIAERTLFNSNASGFTLNHNDNSNINFQVLGSNKLQYQYSSNSWNIPSGVPLLLGTATTTGTASQPLQISGSAYISGSVGIGTTIPTSPLHVVEGHSKFSGVIETVAAATTYMSGSSMVLEMDVRRATTYTYTMPTGANIGIVSFKNMLTQTGSPSGSTLTLLVTQNAAGSGNNNLSVGIGTSVTIVGYENGSSVAGISTRAMVSSGSTITLSTVGNDKDFISFFINYNGGSNTSQSSYQVYATKNGSFRYS